MRNQLKNHEKKITKFLKNNNFFACLLLLRILVNLPNFEMLSHLNKLDLCRLLKKLNNGLGLVVIQLKKKVLTSPTRLGVRAFQSCQGVSLWTFLSLVCGHYIRSGNFLPPKNTSGLVKNQVNTSANMIIHRHEASFGWDAE